MNIFRLVLCFAGILTYLILKEAVTSPPPAGASAAPQPEPLFKPSEPSSTEVMSHSNPLWAKGNAAISPVPVNPAKVSSVALKSPASAQSEAARGE